jgi:hypothetical protein
MAHRDGIASFSARSVRHGDAVHREKCVTLITDRSEWVEISLSISPFRASVRHVRDRRKRLPVYRIACAFSPT